MNLIPYAFNSENILVSVDDVKSGLDCNCVCPDCKSKLIARKGDIKVHHFAHYKEPECKNGYETAIHLKAKEILSKSNRIKLPGENIQIMQFSNPISQNDYFVYYDKVYVEKYLDNIKPDIILEKNGHKLIVELAVTHFVDWRKKEKIKKLGISCIEINMSKVVDLRENNLIEILTLNTSLKSWIYNKRNKLYNWHFKRLIYPEKIQKIKKRSLRFDNHYLIEQVTCPINKHTRDVYSDCSNCPFFSLLTGEFVFCFGRKKNQYENLLNKFLTAPAPVTGII